MLKRKDKTSVICVSSHGVETKRSTARVNGGHYRPVPFRSDSTRFETKEKEKEKREKKEKTRPKHRRRKTSERGKAKINKPSSTVQQQELPSLGPAFLPSTVSVVYIFFIFFFFFLNIFYFFFLKGHCSRLFVDNLHASLPPHDLCRSNVKNTRRRRPAPTQTQTHTETQRRPLTVVAARWQRHRTKQTPRIDRTAPNRPGKTTTTTNDRNDRSNGIGQIIPIVLFIIKSNQSTCFFELISSRRRRQKITKSERNFKKAL